MTDSATFTLGPSLLFCPADRSDRYAKAADRADAIILDLEDAVAPDAKDDARELVSTHLNQTLAGDPALTARTVLRINPASTPYYEADVELLREASVLPAAIMLPKCESRDDVEALASEIPGVQVVALIETARGVIHAAEIAEHPATTAMMWGAEDLVASLGGSSSRNAQGTYRDVPRFARAQVLLAAAAAGKVGVDSIYADIGDLDGLREETVDSVATGWSAKACIHPSHVAVIRDVFRPTEEELEYAQALLAEVDKQSAGVFQFRGSMVDGPLIAHARRVIARSTR